MLNVEFTGGFAFDPIILDLGISGRKLLYKNENKITENMSTSSYIFCSRKTFNFYFVKKN